MFEMDRERFLAFIDWIDDNTIFTGVLEDLAFPRLLIFIERITRWGLVITVIATITVYPTMLNALLSMITILHTALLKIVVHKFVLAAAFPGKIVTLQKLQTLALVVAIVWLTVALGQVDNNVRFHVMDYVWSLAIFTATHMASLMVHLFAVACVHVRKLNSKNNTSLF